MCYNPFRSEQGGGSSENIAKPTKQQLDWHELKPGFYYSTVCNGYYGINDSLPQDTRGKAYRAYVKKVEAQVKELWSSYGPLVEIWFDGGVIPPEEGGQDLMPLLQKYQPDALYCGTLRFIEKRREIFRSGRFTRSAPLSAPSRG